MSKGLANRPQQKVGVDDGASRYDSEGKLWVKHSGEWMVYARYAASRYCEARGVKLKSGVRVEVADSGRGPIPSNITVKPRGGVRIPLKEWVKHQKG